MARYALWSLAGLTALAGIGVAKYKPNGPPLFVCEGAVPLEPNTDKLQQSIYLNSKWTKFDSQVIMATTEDEYKKGWELIGEAKYPPFDKDHVFLFYLHGAIPERQGVGLPAPMQVDVHGVERNYAMSKGGLVMDHVVFHLVATDINPKRPMEAHSPAVFYKIRKDKLDTEYNGTPPITKQTKYEAHEHRVVIRHHGAVADKPGR